MPTSLSLLCCFWSACIAALPAQPARPVGSPQAPAIGALEGIPVIDWQQASAYMHRDVVVQGKVVAAKNIGRLCFLNFDEKNRQAFTAVIHFNDFHSFPDQPETFYLDKYVRVFGRMIEYNYTPEIGVYSPEQIEILDKAPPAATHNDATKAVPVGDVLTLASFNILNLFDNYDNPYAEDESTPTKPREQMEKVAATIRKINPDVIALQEVEKREYLARFVQVMLADMGYEHVVELESNDIRGIDCAVLSRVPIGPVTTYRYLRWTDDEGRTQAFNRDLLRVNLQPEGKPDFDLFVVHLKSKSSKGRSDEIRLGEARKVREVLDGILKKDQQARFVLCGDFNDDWDSPALMAIRGEKDEPLKCFATELPPEKRITYNRPPHQSMIDYIFCSPAMAERYMPGSYRIFPGSVDTSGSDHNPVALRFRLGSHGR